MSERKDRVARIVVIDSGLKIAHPHLRGMGDVVCGPTFDADGVTDDPEQVDRLGHGTAVAATILERAPGSWLCSLKVFDERPECPFGTVLRALEHAIDLDPDLVNLSLGTPNLEWVEPLEALLAQAARRGVRIVAPADFQGRPSYPGSLDAAEGVAAIETVPRDAPTFVRGVWHASPYPREIPGIPKARWAGSSFAVANVTGHLARLLTSSQR